MTIVGIIIVVVLLLGAGGFYARRRQLARTRPAFERSLAQVDQDLAAAAAADRGWDRSLLEAAARRIAAEQLGAEPEELTLVEVLDRPGTEHDEAVFSFLTQGAPHRLVLGRHGDEWVAASS